MQLLLERLEWLSRLNVWYSTLSQALWAKPSASILSCRLRKSAWRSLSEIPGFLKPQSAGLTKKLNGPGAKVVKGACQWQTLNNIYDVSDALEWCLWFLIMF